MTLGANLDRGLSDPQKLEHSIMTIMNSDSRLLWAVLGHQGQRIRTPISARRAMLKPCSEGEVKTDPRVPILILSPLHTDFRIKEQSPKKSN